MPTTATKHCVIALNDHNVIGSALPDSGIIEDSGIVCTIIDVIRVLWSVFFFWFRDNPVH